MKELLLANKAVARGVYEAGVKVAAAYPGTPSTEITENIAKYDEIYSEWSPNEKVAAEVAVGASFAGARSVVTMKHVGVNVAADPLFTAAYTGVNAGMMLIVADDPGMHSSQNEQDSRFYARSAHVPMLEPSDSQEAKDFVKIGMELSEIFDTPVMLRLTTRVAHSQSFVELGEREEIPNKPYQKDTWKYVMMPAQAKARHIAVEKREEALREYADTLPMNRIEMNNKKIGVITAGGVYQYVKEATDYSVLKLGMVYPLPMKLIKEFADTVDELVVAEELEPFIENQLKANGIPCKGKELFGLQGELSTAKVRKAFGLGEPVLADQSLPVRPPVMCAGCPHRGVFYVLKKLGMIVTGDIGCYTLGANAPLNAIDACVCMGASVSMAHGFNKARGTGRGVVGVIGDSTFIHSGITGIINSVYNKGTSTVIILDNSITGMTGHQDNPATGKTIKGEPTYQLDLVDLVKACGVPSVRVVDAYDLQEVEKAVKEEDAKECVSVIVAKRPCVLLTKKYDRPYTVEGCKNCKACLKIGCPAIERTENGVRVNKELCTSCGVCAKLCKFGALKKEDESYGM